MSNIKNMEQRKNEATGVLMDEIWAIKQDIEKVNLLVQDVFTGFFDKYEVNNPRDRENILHEFEANRIYIDMVGDYLFKAKKLIEELEERGDRETRILIKEEELKSHPA